MHKIYRYIVEYYDKFKDEEVAAKGLVSAKDYMEAVKLLLSDEHGYGEDLISIKVIDLDDSIISDDDLAIDLKRE